MKRLVSIEEEYTQTSNIGNAKVDVMNTTYANSKKDKDDKDDETDENKS